jgi:hypothetical protein
MNFKKRTTIFFAAVITLCCFGYMGHSVNAFTPEWQEKQDVDITGFQYMIQIPPVDVAVPTVVSVQLPVQQSANKSSVVINKSGTLVQSLFKLEGESEFASVKVLGNGTNPMALADSKINTTSDFPVEGFMEGEENTVGLIFLFSKKITTSELHITPAPNTTLPETVMIEADKSSSSGDIEVVVSEKELNDWVMHFPEVVTSKILVTFTLSQPLRLSEMKFVQKPDTSYKETVRFLAQPGEEYVLYFDADRVYGDAKGAEVIGLSSDEDILVLPTYPFTQNPVFVQADSDKDSVSDTVDNCPNVANSDQLDIDRNGRGDVCDDFDKDGVMTTEDNCPNNPNRDQRDTDGDGLGDVCDTEENRLTERNPWIPWVGMGIAGCVLIGLLVLSIPKKKEEGVVTTEENVLENQKQESEEGETQ